MSYRDAARQGQLNTRAGSPEPVALNFGWLQRF
jgi:hypothetical protein